MPIPHARERHLIKSPLVCSGLCCIQTDDTSQSILVPSEPVSARPVSQPVSARPIADVRLSPRTPAGPTPVLSDQVLEFERRLQSSVALIMEQQYERLSGEVLDIVRRSHKVTSLRTSGRPHDKVGNSVKIWEPTGQGISPAAPDGTPPLLKPRGSAGDQTRATKNDSPSPPVVIVQAQSLSDILGNSCPPPSSFDDEKLFAVAEPLNKEHAEDTIHEEHGGAEYGSLNSLINTALKGNGNSKGTAGRFTVAVQPFVERMSIPSSEKQLSVGKEASMTADHTNLSETAQELDGSRFAVQSSVKNKHQDKDPKFRLSQALAFQFGMQGWRVSLQQVLMGTMFGLLSSALIFSYAALIGVETNMIAADPDSNSKTIKALHYVYAGIFGGELLTRFIAFGWGVLTGPDGFWNKLDLAFLSSAIVEIVMEIAAGSASGANSVVRPVRILRVVRTVRLVRAFRQFHEFQKMAYALLSSMRTLACSMAVMIFVMFLFSVWLTQSAADIEARAEIPDLELRYGNLMSTTYTLFLSVSGGISWDLCYMPLYDLNPIASFALIVYISMTLFGVLNVITSIFVESVMRSMQHSRDLIVQEKEEEKKIAIVHVKEVFRHLDSDGSGQITTEELEHFLKEPSLRKYMEALDIEADDTRLLFRLLDRDGSGVISSDEFCEGCLRLKGSAKSIDVHALIFSLKAFLVKWSDFTAYVDENFSHLRKTHFG